MPTQQRVKKAEGSSAEQRRIRYAVVGLGYIAQGAVLPAFANAREDCELAALVSDDPEKREQLSRQYGVERSYSYEQYEECLASGIDAVFIALPNSLHHPYTVKAAKAGVHVLCEKPMAVSESACREMIDAAKAGGVKLMIGYRLHFERANLKAVALANQAKLGELRFFHSSFSMQVKEGDIRTDGRLGGGSVYDLGIYCINAARYLFRSEPVEVAAMSVRGAEERFSEIDEMTSAIMRFPDNRLAAFTSSFGAASTSSYELVGSKGSLRVDPAYEYSEGLRHFLTVDGKTRKTSFPHQDQFAAEIAYFARCIRDGVDPEPSGAEGLADVRVIRAIYRSAKEHRSIRLDELEETLERPRPEQQIDRPAPKAKPELINAEAPSRED